MFFSNATRPTVSATGRSGRDAVTRPKTCAVTAFQPVGIESGGDDADLGSDSVAAQRLRHLRRRRDHRVNRVALPAGHAARDGAQDRTRDVRQVVMEVFLEVRVVGLHHGNGETARKPQTHEMGNEGRVNVDQVEIAMQGLDRALEVARDDHTVFRVEREVTRPDTDDARLVLAGFRVPRHDEHTCAALGIEIPAEGLDRRGDPVDAGKVDVGKHQDARRAHRQAGID